MRRHLRARGRGARFLEDDGAPGPGAGSDRDNLDRVVNVLLDLNATLTLAPERRPGPRERQALYRGRNLSLSTSAGDVDIVQRLPGGPAYAGLAQRATTVSPFGLDVLVASRDDLLVMKRARGSALDLADLERLTDVPEGD